MATEPKHATIAEAFLAAQRKMENPVKAHTATVPTKSGGQFSYTYASLDDTLAVVKAALNEMGITVAQPTVTQDGLVGVRTLFIHEAGETWDMGTLAMADPGDPQKLGGIITYLRRYALSSAAGIAAEEDSDAASVGPVATAREAGARAQEAKSDGITEPQRKLIQVCAKELGLDTDGLHAVMKEVTGKESSTELTKRDASALIERLKELQNPVEQDLTNAPEIPF